VSYDAVMLRVFPITLTGVAKRWVDCLSPGTVDSWGLLKKAFIQRNIDSSSNSGRIVAIVNKLDILSRDMMKPKENVHGIQVGCQTFGGSHLDKEYPQNKEVKSVEEVKYGEFRCSSPFSNGAKYHVGPPGYYTRIDNRKSFGEKRPSLEELMNKPLEEST
ncbi:hypothetical protein Tco_1325897, partial [Tanacetum coccineum]